jgi:hypothetical protein
MCESTCSAAQQTGATDQRGQAHLPRLHTRAGQHKTWSDATANASNQPKQERHDLGTSPMLAPSGQPLQQTACVIVPPPLSTRDALGQAHKKASESLRRQARCAHAQRSVLPAPDATRRASACASCVVQRAQRATGQRSAGAPASGNTHAHTSTQQACFSGSQTQTHTGKHANTQTRKHANTRRAARLGPNLPGGQLASHVCCHRPPQV